MSPISSKNAMDATGRSVRRAPLSSVSTRIVLCVFVSATVTALVVSWLSIGAVHEDVRARTRARAETLIAEHVDRVEGVQIRAAQEMTAAAAVGGPWLTDLEWALDARPDAAFWTWQADDSAPRIGHALPAPPPAIAARFARLEFTRAPTPPPAPANCLAARTDLLGRNATRVGQLVGCLSRDALYEALPSSSRASSGMRLLIADATGRILLGSGLRAHKRIDDSLPGAGTFQSRSDGLASYEAADGTSIVGRRRALGSSGWALVAEADRALAFAPAVAIAKQILIVDVCVILLFSLVAHRTTAAIMRPIEAISRGAQRIAEGHVDYEIPSPSNRDDELAALTHTFNGMMRKLRSSQLEIEDDRLRLAEQNEELQRANEILAQLSITDGLTQLHNHRYFQDYLTREIKRASRTQAPLSMILLDIDDFKLLNDTHGHAAGDEVLVSLAAIMTDSARESDLIARYGGEEFVVLMPNTDLAGAVHLAEKLRMTVESTRLIIGDSLKPIEITISLGVALFEEDRRAFFAGADRALYAAKAAGKNCVIIAGTEDEERA